MRPSIRHLEIFRLFSRVLNVTETARILRVTQPSVSQALKDLEVQLGVSLLIRSKSGLRLTPAAEELLTSMDGVLDNMQMLADRAARLRGEQRNQLSISTVLPLTTALVPRAVGRVRRDKPDVRITIESYSSREVVQRVQDRSVDLGLTFLPIEVPDLIQHPLMTTEMVCLLPPAHALSAKEVITADDLLEETIITMGLQVRQEFDVRLAFDRPLDDNRFITTNLSTIASDMVRQGMGVAITLPYVLQHLEGSRVRARPFRPLIKRSLVAVFHNHPGLSPIGRLFLKHLRAELRAFADIIAEHGLSSRIPS